MAKPIILTFFGACLLFLFAPFSRPPQSDMDSMLGMIGNQPAAREVPAVAAKRLADKWESEFNHHLAGFFVMFAGVFILTERHLAKPWPVARYAWPMCFIVAGLFVLVFSDTEMWPVGPQNPWYAITHEPEDLQHKVFSIILLAVGYVELQRARGRWKTRLAAWFFPVVAVAGAILLLFHAHTGDMQAPNAMAAMEHIQTQHRWFAITGLGVAVANGLAGTPHKWRLLFTRVWPALMMILGVLLMAYTE
jgi:putative copper resistance protein D